ncbi:hypothetical protein F5146DRAFT_1142206 [Armillaria mellea]|nr:hypothetical protein F5146DRAFT_1142206 [Armillaria mellea]
MPTLVAKLSRPKAIAEAKIAAASCFPQAVVVARVHDTGVLQTIVVTLENEDEVMVQLRDCEIDLFKVALARSLLSSVVPNIQSGEASDVVFPYMANLIPGTLWDRVETSADEELMILLAQSIVVPRLQKILEMEDFSGASEAHRRLEGLLNPDRVSELKSLPLSLCHIDINHRNILVDNDKHMCGLIDWEHANLLPLAINAWCIRFPSITIAAGKHLPEERTIPMAEAFWNAFISDLPPYQRSIAHKRAVLAAMQTGLAIIHHLGDYCVSRTQMHHPSITTRVSVSSQALPAWTR